MKLERSDVEFPLWRKKVDKSLFEHNYTSIPLWAGEMWHLPNLFDGITSKKDTNSTVKIRFAGKSYNGWITPDKHGRGSKALRLHYQKELSLKLKYTFLMSYMRSLEYRIDPKAYKDIEEEIPFWEFLDIEFNHNTREFRFVAHYRQSPSFPNLFQRLIESPGLKRISDDIEGKKNNKVHGQDWRARDDLSLEIGAQNVIYFLLDSERKLLYVGETNDLIARLNQRYPSIPHWNFYRYNVLPDELAPFRVTLERMVIRDLATLLPNKKNIKSHQITNFLLANEKIDE